MKHVSAPLVSLLVAALLTAACVAASVTAPAPSSTMTLKRVVFAHRHGARMPVLNVANSCGSLGCGSLTEQGAKMLESLGRNFRARYGSVIPEHYDYRTTKVLTDLSPRCSQSAEAFHKALYAPYNKSNGTQTTHPLDLAVMDTTHGDITLPWKNKVTFVLHRAVVERKALGATFAEVEQTVISKAKIEALKVELKVNPALICPKQPILCFVFVIDFAFAMQAQGTLSQYPLTQQYLPLLQRAIKPLFRAAFNGGYNVTNNLDFYDSAGYAGAGLLLAMLESSANDKGVVVSEYSAHDLSLMALYVAMGLNYMPYPTFATAVVFEVYEVDGLANKLFIKPVLATCDQLPGDHPYAWSALAANCTNEANVTYTTTRGCPYDDFVRFAQTRVTKSPAGNCYAWPQDLKAANCTGAAAPAQDTACWKYRSACPLYACGAGRYMAPDLSCHKTA